MEMERSALQPPFFAERVEVWRCQLPAGPFSHTQLACLSPPEHARAAQLIDIQTRQLFVAAALMKRQVLARHLGLPPAELRFGVGPHGKPLLSCEQNPNGLRFNLSHSGTVALLAITRGRDVGIDIERLRPLDWRGVAAQVFSPAERQSLEAEPPAQQPAAFFQLWTAKEAYLKALGCGLSLPPERVSLDLLGADLRVVQAAPDDPAAWQGRLFHVQDGYQAALVVQATSSPLEMEIQLLDWTPQQPPSSLASIQAAD